ncbi:MAG: transketolase [Sphaerochaetaceae bacterium]|nr:transketolase [Sphaerochaetaceae bacterium]
MNKYKGKINMNNNALELQAVITRRDIVQMIYDSKTGHTGGSLSSADIMTVLYFSVLNVNPTNPKDPNRDYFILSKGHSIECYLSVLAEKGFFPKDKLKTYSKFKSDLMGHPSNKIPGIEMNTGSLGHGLSIGVGCALGLKKLNKKNKVFVLMGDGEQAEGSIWEAVMASANYNLDNLVAIIDRNRLQISGETEDIMSLNSLKDKYEAFNWEVIEVDGNDIAQLSHAFIKEHPNKPLLVIANTIKGKGIKEIENIAKWHHGVPTKEIYCSAMKQFEEKEKEIIDEKINFM